MTRVVWDKIDERRYESGLDHGVLYPPGGVGVAWNGFTSFDAGTGLGDITPLYIDGVKYMDVRGRDEFSGNLTAYTYPDEFLDFEGVVELADGVFADAQAPKPFDLVFRVNHNKGYRLHIFYNLIASPDAKSYGTISSAANPADFSWSLSSMPIVLPGYDPTEHFIFDSETLDPNLLTYFESVMFGSETSDPMLPPITTLMSAALNWDPKFIDEGVTDRVSGGTPSNSGADFVSGGTPASAGGGSLDGGTPSDVISSFSGVATLVSRSDGDLVASDVPGFYVTMPKTRLKPADISGLYELE